MLIAASACKDKRLKEPIDPGRYVGPKLLTQAGTFVGESETVVPSTGDVVVQAKKMH
jgi:hypothetical protein